MPRFYLILGSMLLVGFTAMQYVGYSVFGPRPIVAGAGGGNSARGGPGYVPGGGGFGPRSSHK